MKKRNKKLAIIILIPLFAVVVAVVIITADGGSDNSDLKIGDGNRTHTVAPTNITERKKIRRLPASENPGYSKVFLEAERLTKAGDLPAAIKAYEEAHKIEPKSIETLVRMGEISLALNNYNEAGQYFAEAQLIAPQNTDITLELAKTALRKRDIGKAKELLDGITPPTEESKLYQAMILATLNQTSESQQLLNDIIETGGNPYIKNDAQLILNQFELFRLNREGKTVHLQALLANAFNSLGEHELAITLGFEALKLKHDYRDIWLIIGHSSLKTGKFRDAKDALKKAIQLDSQRADSYFFLGMAQSELKEWNDAHKSFSKAVQFKYEPDILVTQQHAPVLFELGKYKEALEAYEKLLTFDATNISMFEKPTEIAIENLHNSEKALKLGSWAAQLHPEEYIAHNLLGWAQLNAGLLDAAKSSFNKALALRPAFEDSTYHLAQAYEAEGEYDRALDTYEKAYAEATKKGNNKIANMAQKSHELLKQSLNNTP